jgi:hypothetical protein
MTTKKSTAAKGRKALDAAIREIADRAFTSGFNEAFAAAAKLCTRGSSRRVIEKYLKASGDTTSHYVELDRRQSLAQEAQRSRRQAGRAGAAS